jgi:hypothetical protein
MPPLGVPHLVHPPTRQPGPRPGPPTTPLVFSGDPRVPADVQAAVVLLRRPPQEAYTRVYRAVENGRTVMRWFVSRQWLGQTLPAMFGTLGHLRRGARMREYSAVELGLNAEYYAWLMTPRRHR